MSLYKQLWLSIIFLLCVSFLGSFVVSFLSAKSYLEEQLYRKNIDNASSLALSLSSQGQDETFLELFINSQFDTGHYQFINLVDMNGKTIVAQFDDSNFNEAPKWLMALFPINIKPGFAQVSNGWQQIGTLTLSSHVRFAYRQLWQKAKNLFYYFVLMVLCGGVAGSVLLRWLIKPLNHAVIHAKAIGERRFIVTEEPRTLEFREVIRSLNKLSEHVKRMLHDESTKLDKWRQEIQYDKITGLLNREPILNYLKSVTKKHDKNAGGHIILIRINDLFHLNQKEGRKTMDILLKKFGEVILSECESRSPIFGASGRLNGSDFIIILPGENHKIETSGQEILDNLNRVSREIGIEQAKLIAASSPYYVSEQVSTILMRIDGILASAAVTDTSPFIYINQDNSDDDQIKHIDNWQETLRHALKDKKFYLELFPVMNKDYRGNNTNNQNTLLHYEAPARLTLDKKNAINAGRFMPHVNRFGFGHQLDLCVTELAVAKLLDDHKPIGINISSAILSHPESIHELIKVVRSADSYSHLLWLELPEYGVFQNLEGFKTLCKSIKPLGCKIGIEHVGQEVMHLGNLHDLGLDYVKVDSAFIHNIDENISYQIFLRGLCTIVHSIGLQAIAEGVENQTEWETLIELGFDGGTGCYFRP